MPGHPVGQGHVAAAALLGHLHQPRDVGQQRALADGQGLQAQGRLEVQRAGEDAVARADGGRQGLAGDQARVDLRRRPARDPAVDADALARGGQDRHAGPDLLDGQRGAPSSASSTVTVATRRASRRSTAERARPRARPSR